MTHRGNNYYIARCSETVLFFIIFFFLPMRFRDLDKDIFLRVERPRLVLFFSFHCATELEFRNAAKTIIVHPRLRLRPPWDPGATAPISFCRCARKNVGKYRTTTQYRRRTDKRNRLVGQSNKS